MRTKAYRRQQASFMPISQRGSPSFVNCWRCVEQSKAADDYFAKQRQQADKCTDEGFFFDMMIKIAGHLQQATKAFDVLHSSATSKILDFCMAPGGFLDTVLKLYPESRATAFSLAPEKGGHKVLMQKDRAEVNYMDITMLAADMGVTSIPKDHEDSDDFLPLEPLLQQQFDLVICDGSRLLLTQLTLGLEHLHPGGTMIVLLHKLESYDNVLLLSQFNRIAKIKLFKHTQMHAPKSSFYMVASGVDSQSEEAIELIEGWRKVWQIATFGTDEEFEAVTCATVADAERLLAEFGDQLKGFGTPIWESQLKGLEKLVKKVEEPPRPHLMRMWR
ncbi:hypothetical protein LTR97_002877 [Elasticomyces elasticus]|uniref:Ribosomal RNA methyltransferase FtsJ domain-containing protein n=1 Tax=Elasticomyces elasticus TaxID=574655 RepID=A0AAN7WFG6_9PEZI|nr:hypothetical protein LTR97_002877 [Elasticomyces elasticus]